MNTLISLFDNRSASYQDPEIPNKQQLMDA